MDNRAKKPQYSLVHTGIQNVNFYLHKPFRIISNRFKKILKVKKRNIPIGIRVTDVRLKSEILCKQIFY